MPKTISLAKNDNLNTERRSSFETSRVLKAPKPLQKPKMANNIVKPEKPVIVAAVAAVPEVKIITEKEENVKNEPFHNYLK